MSRLKEFESSPLLSRFSEVKDGIYLPSGAYLREAVEIRLGKDRKGQVVSAELRVAFSMLDHPLLGKISADLIDDFFALCLDERPAETTSRKWLTEEGEARLKCPGGTVVRRRLQSFISLSVQAGKGFLSGWFGR